MQTELKGLPFIILSLLFTFMINNGIRFGLDGVPGLIAGLYFFSFVAILVGIIANRRLPGMPIAALGTLANFAVIIANGLKMPVSTGMFNWISPRSFHVSTQALTHSVMSEATKLPFLADVILIPPGYPLSGIYSIGDLLLYTGIAWAIGQLMVSPDPARL